MGNEGYEEIFEMIVTKLTEQCQQELRTSNEEIDGLMQGKIELSVQVQTVIKKLDVEWKNILEEYYDLSEKIADKQIKHLYLQGAKDCVQLLKKIGVL